MYLGTEGFLLKLCSELAGLVVQMMVCLLLLFFQSHSSCSQIVVIIGLKEIPSSVVPLLKSSSLSSLSTRLL